MLMPTNLDRYQKDFDALILLGGQLQNAIQYECYPTEFKTQLATILKKHRASTTPGPKEKRVDAIAKFLEALPSFKVKYQSWYSEAQLLIKQLLPDRLGDFTRLYDKPKARKSIGYENYRIEDYMQGLTVTYLGETKVGPSAAIPHFDQQLAILKSVEQRFKSSLFDIRQLVQADLLDSELQAGRELAKHKFLRAAGALAGVVLEKHLAQVCENRSLKPGKQRPTINDFNQLLKDSDAIDTQAWRFNQFLADIRNLCDHDKKQEPTEAQIADLLDGVAKVTKTIF
jgi:hypothetical protein